MVYARLSKLVKHPVRPLRWFRHRRISQTTEDVPTPFLSPDGRSPAERSEDMDSRLREIQLNVYRGRLESDISYVKVVGDEMCELLSRSSLGRHSVNTIGRLLRLLGFNHHYDQGFFDSVSDALMKTKDGAAFNALLPSFLWVCSRSKYYPQALLSHAGAYLLDNVHHFSSRDISKIVHTFAMFNHHIPGLIDTIEKWYFKYETLSCESHLPWNLVWAGMVFGDYPHDMLKAILKDDFIAG
jgi:hypothetical protein